MGRRIVLRIVVLDGFCLNPGDLSWGAAAGLADKILIYDRTPKELIVERAYDAEIVITNKVVFDKAVLDALPNLRYIGVLATGYNVIDCDYARKKGVIVTNIPAYSTESVVQSVFGLIIELATGIGAYNNSVKKGDWVCSQDFCYQIRRSFELAGKTIGIIGFGQIGQRIKDVALAFGMRVLVNNKQRTGEGEGYRYVPLDELLKESDIVTLNCPQTADNTKMINKKTLSLMKSSAVLINAARGGLVDEEALADALNMGKIAGAGLDVLAFEPAREDNPLLSAKNCVINPHIAWATFEARSRLMDIATANIAAFIRGEPINVVNK